MAHVVGGEAEKPTERPVHHRPLEGNMAYQRSDAQGVAVVGDVVEFSHLVDVHQHRWPGETEVHGRYQALAACQDLGVVSVSIQDCQRPFDGTCLVVVESGWLHAGRSVLSGRQPEVP